MAKKSSSQAAMQMSEPRVQTFSNWSGINIKMAPVGWEQSDNDHLENQTDLKNRNLVVQNNICTTSNNSLETRDETDILIPNPNEDEKVLYALSNVKFNGVHCLYDNKLFLVGTYWNASGAYNYRTIYQFTYRDDVSSPGWYLSLTQKDKEDLGIQVEPYTDNSKYIITLTDGSSAGYNINITEIAHYNGRIIVLYKYTENSTEGRPSESDFKHGRMLDAELSTTYQHITDTRLQGCPLVEDPTRWTFEHHGSPELLNFKAQGSGFGFVKGSDHTPDDGYSADVLRFKYAYLTKYGTTLPSSSILGPFYINKALEEITSEGYPSIRGPLPSDNTQRNAIEAVNIYLNTGNNTDWLLIGQVAKDNFKQAQVEGWYFDFPFLGGIVDTSLWTSDSPNLPEENTTRGPDAEHVNIHDSRLYFRGGSKPYRIYIGGNAPHELSVAQGFGGGFVDALPGSNIIVNQTHKWKTYSGSNIITAMCGSENTHRIIRGNLVEDALAVTSSYTYTGRYFEEVSNVVGCNSMWGSGVWGDGLYSISRYGLTLTTMAMEYNNQMRSSVVSDAIQPIFTDILASRLKNARMIYIDEIIYFILGDENLDTLDKCIFCYDVNGKAWYTFTVDCLEGNEHVKHIFNLDYIGYIEGIGIITDKRVLLIPTTGSKEDSIQQIASNKKFMPSKILTSELSTRTPRTQSQYISQLEFNFDYFIGEATILIDGLDYYGRRFTVEHNISHGGPVGPSGTLDIDRDRVEYVRIDKLIESYHVTILSKAHFRLTHINAKVYTQSNKIGLVYGFDSAVNYKDHHKTNGIEQHHLKNYNDYRKILVT